MLLAASQAPLPESSPHASEPHILEVRQETKALPVGDSVRQSCAILAARQADPSILQGAAAARPPVKLTSLQSSEAAHKREELLELERRQKKELLVRQREAAREAALQKASAGPAKAAGEPLATGAPAAEPAAGTALPRLKQMIEVCPACPRVHTHTRSSHILSHTRQRSLRMSPTAARLSTPLDTRFARAASSLLSITQRTHTVPSLGGIHILQADGAARDNAARCSSAAESGAMCCKTLSSAVLIHYAGCQTVNAKRGRG